jgi:hypothetical protein
MIESTQLVPNKMNKFVKKKFNIWLNVLLWPRSIRAHSERYDLIIEHFYVLKKQGKKWSGWSERSDKITNSACMTQQVGRQSCTFEGRYGKTIYTVHSHELIMHRAQIKSIKYVFI